MRNHRRYVMLAPALAMVVIFAAPTVDAGGGVGLHIGSGGFGVSVGFGDWGVYTRSWSDPYWSIDFNATLAGYGQWVWVEGLGRVWRPWVASSWRPYTYGRWVSTSYGLTWVAYEPWGYVPHHYGSWAHSSFGWVWVPGYSYSCANVMWVGSGGYVGWYARPPWGWSHAQRGFRHGYRHGFNDGYHNGYNNGWHDARYATYVGWNDFGADNVARHTVTHRIASQNRIEARTMAPTRDEIRRRGGAALAETQLSRRTVTVDGREVTIARPEGVARSIERNAAETVTGTLSEEALERRQPLVRPRTTRATAAASSSRPAGVSRDTLSPQVQRSTRGTESSRTQQSQISARSASVRRSNDRSTRTGESSRVSPPAVDERQKRDDTRLSTPRTSRHSGVAKPDRARTERSISARSRSAAASREIGRRSEQSSNSQQSRARAERSITDRQRSAPAQRSAAASQRNKAPQPERRAVKSRQSQSRSQKTRASRSKNESDNKETRRSARRRQR